MFGYHDVPNWKADQTIRAIVEATFPDYRRKTVSIKASESVELHDLNWSGGTRNEYRAALLDGSASGGSTLPYSHLHPDQNHAEGKSVPVPQGAVLVRGGSFCGKPSMLTIYVNPADMPRLLTAPEA